MDAERVRGCTSHELLMSVCTHLSRVPRVCAPSLRYDANGQLLGDTVVLQYTPQGMGGLQLVLEPGYNMTFPMPTMRQRRCRSLSVGGLNGQEECHGRGECGDDGTCTCNSNLFGGQYWYTPSNLARISKPSLESPRMFARVVAVARVTAPSHA